MTIPRPSDEVSRIMTLMPEFWKDDHKLREATKAARVNLGVAYDQAPPGASFEADHYKFMHGRDQMPMTTSPSGAAAMPASLSPDNYTGSSGRGRSVGGMQFHRRNGNAGDNGDPAPIGRLPSAMVARELGRRNGNATDHGGEAEALFNAIAAAPEAVQLQLFQALASQFGYEIGEAEAEDQGAAGGLRLPVAEGGEAGVQPGSFFENQATEGTWRPGDPQSRGPSGTADSRYGYDSRPRNSRERRQLAVDRAAGISHLSPADRAQAFDSRWGALTAHVECWR